MCGSTRKSVRVLVLLTTCIVFLAVPCPAKSYYVAPNGTTDGDGTRDRPFNVQHVLKNVRLQPGDEVVFLDGVYKPPIIIKSKGTEQAPIIFRAENRGRAIVDGGTRITGWKKSDEVKGAWESRVESVPRWLLVNGEILLRASSRWRAGKKAFAEGTFTCEKVEPKKRDDPAVAGELEGTKKTRPRPYLLGIRPWAEKPPEEVYSTGRTLVTIGGAFNIVDGFLIRRGGIGVHMGGEPVHTYKVRNPLYRSLCGLVNHVYGTFNILRNCIVRDMCGQGMTTNECRFNLVEDNVIYNAGFGQGLHGIYISQGAENLTLRRNVWWRTSGAAIHIYCGSGIDSLS